MICPVVFIFLHPHPWRRERPGKKDPGRRHRSPTAAPSSSSSSASPSLSSGIAPPPSALAPPIFLRSRCLSRHKHRGRSSSSSSSSFPLLSISIPGLLPLSHPCFLLPGFIIFFPSLPSSSCSRRPTDRPWISSSALIIMQLMPEAVHNGGREEKEEGGRKKRKKILDAGREMEEARRGERRCARSSASAQMRAQDNLHDLCTNVQHTWSECKEGGGGRSLLFRPPA